MWMGKDIKQTKQAVTLRELTSVSTGGFPGAETELTSVRTGGFRFRTMRFFRQRAGRGFLMWYRLTAMCSGHQFLSRPENFFRRLRRAVGKIFPTSDPLTGEGQS